MDHIGLMMSVVTAHIGNETVERESTDVRELSGNVRGNKNITLPINPCDQNRNEMHGIEPSEESRF